MNKKILSIFLSLVMVFSLVNVSFAQETDETEVTEEAVTEIIDEEKVKK